MHHVLGNTFAAAWPRPSCKRFTFVPCDAMAQSTGVGSGVGTGVAVGAGVGAGEGVGVNSGKEPVAMSVGVGGKVGVMRAEAVGAVAVSDGVPLGPTAMFVGVARGRLLPRSTIAPPPSTSPARIRTASPSSSWGTPTADEASRFR